VRACACACTCGNGKGNNSEETRSNSQQGRPLGRNTQSGSGSIKKKGNLPASCDLDEVNIILQGKVSVNCSFFFEIDVLILNSI
jgi:hypothetical protein